MDQLSTACQASSFLDFFDQLLDSPSLPAAADTSALGSVPLSAQSQERPEAAPADDDAPVTCLVPSEGPYKQPKRMAKLPWGSIDKVIHDPYLRRKFNRALFGAFPSARYQMLIRNLVQNSRPAKPPLRIAFQYAGTDFVQFAIEDHLPCQMITVSLRDLANL